MASGGFDADLGNFFNLKGQDQRKIIKELDRLIDQHHVEVVNRWRSTKSKSTFLHRLVELDLFEVFEHAVVKYRMDPKIYRESDGLTALQILEKRGAAADLIARIEGAAGGGEAAYNVNNGENDQDDDVESEDSNDGNENKSKHNIVWVDLEMTSIEDPKVMECAVIITNKRLTELVRKQWVVHYEKQELDSLGPWHQNQFKATTDGGNGLFDECLRSRMTEKQVETELLKLISKYCPEGECPLAGSSIHIDREVLKQRMPSVAKYLHYRIIDVSSFRAMLKRWNPRKDADFMSTLSHGGTENVNHRAMDDIEWSIALMKLFEPMFRGPSGKGGPKKQWNNHTNADRGSSVARKAPRTELYNDEKTLKDRLELEKRFNVKDLHLKPKEQEIYNRNPHLREVFINQRQLLRHKDPLKPEDRLLDLRQDCPVPSSPFSTGSFPETTTEHWAERKLMLTEIEFLTNVVDSRPYTVIYVGASPGFHITMLSQLFPDLQFILLDTKSVETTKTNKIKINNLRFLDDIISDMRKMRKNTLLISNLRRSTPSGNIEDDIAEDLKDQIRWYKDLKPEAALLNYRISLIKQKTKFLSGKLMIEPWSSRRTKDIRVWVGSNAKSEDYNNRMILSAMTYFQQTTRTTYFEHSLDETKAGGLDHCYDCQAEILILSTYLKKIQKIPDEKRVLDRVPFISADISKATDDPSKPAFIQGIRTLDIIPKL